MNNIDILEELKPKKIDLITLIRAFKKEGIDDFIVIRKEKFETLIAENKELKEKIKEINEEYNAEQKHEMENTIPKSKIKAKIEIRKEEKENCKDSIEEKYLLREIYVLQSLLGKE